MRHGALPAYHDLDKRPRILAHALNVRLDVPAGYKSFVDLTAKLTEEGTRVLHVESCLEAHALCLRDASGSQTKIPDGGNAAQTQPHTHTQSQTRAHTNGRAHGEQQASSEESTCTDSLLVPPVLAPTALMTVG